MRSETVYVSSMPRHAPRTLTTIRLDPGDLEALERLAAEHDTGVSQVVRWLLSNALALRLGIPA